MAATASVAAIARRMLIGGSLRPEIKFENSSCRCEVVSGDEIKRQDESETAACPPRDVIERPARGGTTRPARWRAVRARYARYKSVRAERSALRWWTRKYNARRLGDEADCLRAAPTRLQASVHGTRSPPESLPVWYPRSSGTLCMHWLQGPVSDRPCSGWPRLAFVD